MLDPDQIRHARYALSLSQHELARRASVSRTALNQFEQGSYQAGPNFCRKLRDYFEAECVHLEALSQPQPEHYPAAVGPQSRLHHDASPAPATTQEEVGGSEDKERAAAGPLEILAGVGLSLILGRRIGL